MITIYGRIYSRTPRVLWAAEEMAIPYKWVSIDHKTDEIRQPEFLAVNPNGKIPALVDGDLKLFESMAINFYLAKTYHPEFLPTNETDRALALQWSFWGITEVETQIIALFVELVRTPEGQRSQANIDHARRELDRMLAVLEGTLDDRDYLLDDRFTLADLNLASIIALYKFSGPPLADLLSPYPNTNRWFHERCIGRPAFAKVMAMDEPPADLPHLRSNPA